MMTISHFTDIQVVFYAIHSPESTKKMSQSRILPILAADSLKGKALDNGRGARVLWI